MKKSIHIRFILLLVIPIIWGGCAFTQKQAPPKRAIFYPSLPAQPRLQFLTTISGGHDLGQKNSSLQEFLVGNPQYQQLVRPYDVGASKGKIYVMDRMYKKVVIFDLVQKTMSYIDDQGMGSLSNPSGIWISQDDVKYVADMQRKQIVVFDQNNAFFKTYGNKNVFEKPVDVAVFGNRVYVVDMDRDQLMILDKDTGNLIKAVGNKGDFFNPTHVTVGPKGDVFVNDAFNFVIKRFSPDGVLKNTIGFHGDQIGGFARPKGLSIDRDGNLYAVDAAFENVQIFDNLGRLLLFFGGPGNGPGKMYLPAGVAVDYDNVDYFKKFADPDFKVEYLVYVVNAYGKNKLNVYGFGKWIGENLPGE